MGDGIEVQNPRSRIAQDLDWIVMKALEKDPQRRYSSALCLAQDIERHLNSEPVLAAAPAFLYRSGKFARRNRGPLALASLGIAVLALAALGVGLFLKQNGEGRAVRSPSPGAQNPERRAVYKAEPEVATGDATVEKPEEAPVRDSVSKVQATTFVWSKLGDATLPFIGLVFQPPIDSARAIIYSLSPGGVFQSYDMRANRFHQLPVSGQWPGRVDQCIYNPDENTIWFTVGGRGQVFRLPVTGGRVTSVGASGQSPRFMLTLPSGIR